MHRVKRSNPLIVLGMCSSEAVLAVKDKNTVLKLGVCPTADGSKLPLRL